MISRVELFSTKNELSLFLLGSLALFLFNLSFKYYDYLKFTEFDTIRTKAYVVDQYRKNSKNQILKLDVDGLSIYTNAPNSIRDVKGYYVEARLYIDKLSFYEYLRGFYARSYLLKLYSEKSMQQRLADEVGLQHTDQRASDIYGALYFATALSSELKSMLSYAGVNHLVAISGFHVGLIFTFLFFILKGLFYKLYSLKLPYRNINRDLFILSALVIFGYMLLLHSPPSLMRAFAMLVIGYFLYDRGFEVISMRTLFVTVILLAALHVELIFSIGFWLSVAGVYYIFLFLKHFHITSKITLVIAMGFWVYFMMFPISSYLFGSFSQEHILSVLYSLVFVLFYPLSIALHVAGFGGVFDTYLLELIQVSSQVKLSFITTPMIIVYIILSILSLYSRKLTFATVAVVFAVYVEAVKHIA